MGVSGQISTAIGAAFVAVFEMRAAPVVVSVSGVAVSGGSIVSRATFGVARRATARVAVSMVAALLGLGVAPAWAGATAIAVAANFTAPAKEIATLFQAETGHQAILSFGSAGQFYSQIKQGAPFDAFLSADAERPAQLAAEGLAVADSRFVYAVGALVLWSRAPDLVTGEATLRQAAFKKLAVGNPVAAPYGAAAYETLKALGLLETLKPKLVEGVNITQVFQFVETGNAELGFVAASQLIDRQGSRWVVPATLHRPILQEAVLLTFGAANPAAQAFVRFLKTPEARAVIARYGYGAP